MSLHSETLSGHAGLPLTADCGGPEHGQPLIFMHGGGQTRYSWGSSAERLADQGYRVISLDLRGHGDSAWAPDQDYSLDTFVADLKAICTTLDRPPVLIGASLGGVISLLSQGQGLPARGLVMVDVIPRMKPEGIARIQGFMGANPNGFASIDEAAQAVAAYLPHRPRPASTEGLKKNLRYGSDGRWYWHWDPAFQSERQRGTRLSMVERMDAAAEQVSIPTLLVRGRQSEVVSEQSLRDFQQRIPHAEMADIEGASHMVAGDRNDQFNDAIEDFLQRHATAWQPSITSTSSGE